MAHRLTVVKYWLLNRPRTFTVDAPRGQAFTGLDHHSRVSPSRGKWNNLVTSGERPARPADATKLGLPGVLWDLIQFAWAEDAQERPPVEMIIDFLLRTT